MPLRLIEAADQAERAFAVLRASLTHWSGGRARAWTAKGALEPRGDGATFSRRDDLYVFLERVDDEVTLGVALTERDRELLRVEMSRAQPAKRSRRWAFAADESEKLFLLLNVEALRDQDLRDPLRRLSGAPLIKRAEIGARDYVMIGPLGDVRVGDALQAMGGLHPDFDRHIARMGALASEEDARSHADLYAVSREVARMPRVHGRIASALYAHLSAQGFVLDNARHALMPVDFAMTRAADTLVFEIRGDAELADLIRGLGQLILAAPRAARLLRFFVLPSPEGEVGDALARFMPAFEELSTSVLFYDFDRGEPSLRFERADPDLPAAIRALFP